MDNARLPGYDEDSAAAAIRALYRWMAGRRGGRAFVFVDGFKLHLHVEPDAEVVCPQCQEPHHFQFDLEGEFGEADVRAGLDLGTADVEAMGRRHEVN